MRDRWAGSPTAWRLSSQRVCTSFCWLAFAPSWDARGRCAVAESELPMQPITVMRNALGEDQGGSGVAMDPEAYKESVAYWSTHAPIQ